MDWLLSAPQIQSAFSSLGCLESGTYVVNPNALAILEEIIYKLTYEDQTLRTFRRAIGFGQNVRSDLIPLLENANDNAILDAVIRILVNITIPVECLFSVDVMYRTEVGRHTIFELNKLLYTSKEAFTDPKSTKSVIEYMKHILESDSKLSPEKCDQINNCLLLLRNILHIPENNANFIMQATPTPGSNSVSMQNTILWNLFIQSIDKLLLYLMSCPQRAFWGVTMVQLIALIYKDQHVSTLQKLLNLWFEASLSDSSEDNESNTSPPKQGSGDSSPMLTSDPTSDSSDNGSGVSKNECTSEERRQVLREETEATLQAVSRKGQVYQDAILRAEVSDEISKMNTTDSDEPESPSDFSIIPSVEGINIEAMEEADSDEDPAQRQQKEKEQHEKEAKILPAKQSNDTTNVESQTDPEFKPPIAVQSKKNSTTKYTPDEVDDDKHCKPTMKSPHCGQIGLTKGKSCPQKRECPSSQSELSDCGYGTQVENQESISTSSNDDDGPQSKPQHQKPPCNSKPRNKQRIVLTIVDNKELRRKKLVKRSKSNLINMKGLVQHTPSDEDISNLLKEFTVDFLLKGYGFLVEELHSQLTLTHMKIPIDTSHFFWLLTYFLKFATQLELDMEHINTILNYNVLSYLTYEGVILCEELELSVLQESNDPKPCLRRIHLVVTAIREFLQSIETYKKVSHLSQDDRERLMQLQLQISTTEDLRSLFVLLIRRFNPNLHTKQYLQDLVVTNHILLLILDNALKIDETINFNMYDHVSQFATVEIMNFYGMLLEDFTTNGDFVNDCIFTMMHHIGGDLGHIGTLFQPLILKTFSRIWETDYGLCDDWTDLIEYVIHTFMKTPQKSKLVSPNSTLTELIKEYNSENTICTWTQEEMDTLYWYYVQSKKNPDIAGKIADLFKNNGNKFKSRLSIIQQLLQQDIISLVEYDDLMKIENGEYQRSLLTPASSTVESGIELKESVVSSEIPGNDIQMLIDLICKENKQQFIQWLQKLLLECCYIKLNLRNSSNRSGTNLKHIMEPIAYYSILKNHAVPVVQWSPEQASIMMYEPFVLLMHKLGFLLPVDSGTLFVRFPDYWSAEVMFTLAKTLGPLDKLLIKFNVQLLEDEIAANASKKTHQTDPMISESSSNSSTDLIIKKEPDEKLAENSDTNDNFLVPKAKPFNSMIRHTPEQFTPPPMSNWLQLVMRSKCNAYLNQVPEGDVAVENHAKQLNIAPMSGINTINTTKCITTIRSSPSTLLKTSVTSTVTMSTAALPLNNFVTPSPMSVGIALQASTQLPHPSINNVIGSPIVNHNNGKHKSTDKTVTSVTTRTGCTEKIVNKYVARAAAAARLLSTTLTQNIHQSSDTKQMLDDHVLTNSKVMLKPFHCELEHEYSVMVASVNENEVANSDCASVASDLTQMYVSDEDEKHEYRVPHFH